MLVEPRDAEVDVILAEPVLVPLPDRDDEDEVEVPSAYNVDAVD